MGFVLMGVYETNNIIYEVHNKQNTNVNSSTEYFTDIVI